MGYNFTAFIDELALSTDEFRPLRVSLREIENLKAYMGEGNVIVASIAGVSLHMNKDQVRFIASLFSQAAMTDGPVDIEGQLERKRHRVGP